MAPPGKRRRWLAGALLVATLGAGAAAVTLARGRRVLRFEYTAAPLSHADFEALAQGPAWHADVFTVASGVALRGLVRRPAATGGPWVLFFAGNSAQQLAEARRFLDGLTAGRDYGVGVWTYRGYDGADGVLSQATVVDDAARVYAHLQDLAGIPASRVHVVGFSLGAFVAASLAARASAGHARPASLVLLAPPTVIDVATPVPGHHGPADRYDLLSVLGTVAGPVLVVHGSADQTLPVEQGRAVAERLGGRARYVEVPGVGHLELLTSTAALGAVRAVLDAPR